MSWRDREQGDDVRVLPGEDLRDVDTQIRRDAETLAFDQAMRTKATAELDIEMRYQERMALQDRPTFGTDGD